jgi:predicted ABC-type ATPase
MATNPSQPILLLIRGLPGSGKSYLADALQMAIKADLGQGSVVMLDPDATDYQSQAYQKHTTELAEQGVEEKFHPYRFLRAQAHRGISEHKIIIWNQPFTDFDGLNKTLINLQNYATEQGTSLKILIVEVEIDPATAKQRVDQRKQAGGHGPSDTTFGHRVASYQTFAGKGYPTLTVQGSDEIASSVDTVVRTLKTL